MEKVLLSSILDTDSYKLSHWVQYPPGLTEMISYFESRGGKEENGILVDQYPEWYSFFPAAFQSSNRLFPGLGGNGNPEPCPWGDIYGRMCTATIVINIP